MIKALGWTLIAVSVFVAIIVIDNLVGWPLLAGLASCAGFGISGFCFYKLG